ncbi:MAG: MipA/OmpV family protein [Arenicella sp.]
MKKIVFLILAIIIFKVTPAVANPNMPKDTLIGFVSVGVLTVPEFEGSEDTETGPLFATRLQYNHYYIQTRGMGAHLNISPFQNVEFGPSVQYRSARDSSIENNVISRLRKVDSAVDAGAFVRFPFRNVLRKADVMALEVDILTDTSDTHEGTLITFGPSYRYFSSNRRWSIGTSMALTYASTDFNNTYFSIDADNSVRSGLPQFNADSGINSINLSLTANYQFNKRWGLIGLIGYKKLLGEVADSPIVDIEGTFSQLTGGIGLSYRF